MKTNDKQQSPINTENTQTKNLSGYPLYPENEDIYNQSKKEEHIHPGDISANKSSAEIDTEYKADLVDNLPGNELDIPGAELDDEQELTGSEDEENNYYSIGGDEHQNLEDPSEE